jgi:uncharacterized membrane protein YfcA
MEPVIGFLIAFLVGMTGQGGGPLTVPLLVLVVGMPAAEAVGTSLLFVMITKLTASPMFLLRGKIDWKILKLLLAGGIPGVIFGSLLISNMSQKRLENVVLAVVGGTIALMAASSLWRLWRRGITVARKDRSGWLPAIAAAIGIEVGFSSAGAGALGAVAMMGMTQMEAASIVGTDLLFGLGLAAAGSAMHLAFGVIQYGVVLKLVSGGILGALAGSALASRVPARALRVALSAILAILGAQLFWRGVGHWLG